jgi:hypothetical protein
MLSFVKLDGGRNWNKTEFPNFKDQIFSSLDSQISNTIDKVMEKTAQTNANVNNCKFVSDNNNGYEELLEYSIN